MSESVVKGDFLIVTQERANLPPECGESNWASDAGTLGVKKGKQQPSEMEANPAPPDENFKEASHCRIKQHAI